MNMSLSFFIHFILLLMRSTLDAVKLKEKGRTFHDLFLTKVSITVLSFWRIRIVYQCCQMPISNSLRWLIATA